jgi:hypothetical protein
MWLALLAAALTTATGWMLVAALLPRYVHAPGDLTLRASLAIGVGLCISSMGFFVALLMQSTAAWHLIIIDAVLLALALLVHRALRRSTGQVNADLDTASRNPRWFNLIVHGALLGAAAVAVAAIVTRYRALPHGHWDAWAIWNLKARFFYAGGEAWSHAFSPVIPWSHTDYPLLLPLNVARLWTYAGADGTLIPAMLSMFYSILSVTTLYGAVSLFRGRVQGAIAALALLATAGFVKHAALQIADTPVGFYLLAAVCVSALALQESTPAMRRFVLAGICIGAAAWTKNEGMLMAAALLISVTVVRAWSGGLRQAWRSIRGLALGLFLPLTCLIILKVAFAGESDLLDDQSGRIVTTKVFDVSRHWMIITTAGAAVWTVAGTWLLIALGAVALCAVPTTFKPRPHLAAVALVLLLIVAGYYSVYLITPRDLQWHLQTSCDRLVIQLWPSMLFLLFATVRGPLQVRVAAG